MKKHLGSALRASTIGLSAVLIVSCGGKEVTNDGMRTDMQEMQKRDDNWLTNVPLIGDVIKNDVIDPRGGLSREDYKELFYPNENGKKRTPKYQPKKAKNKELLGMRQLMVSAEKPIIADDKLVTISVTEDVPLKEVIIELARKAGVDVEVDPSIEGGVIFSMKDRPFSTVIGRLSDLAGLTYEVRDGVLRVSRDMPVIKSYRMNLLNMVRTSTSEVNINTDLLGGENGGEGGSSGGLSSGSNSNITATSNDGDMWAGLESGINNLLAQYSNGSSSNMVSIQQGSAPITGNAVLPSSILSVQRQAGLITIMANNRQHKEIKAFLDQVQIAHSSQVLIEAKILEVSLADEYRSGINWSFLDDNITGITATSTFGDLGLEEPASQQTFSFGILPTELFGIDNSSIEATVELVEKFGTTRTLSSPRLHAMNNQYAVLTFAENFVYFELDVEEEEQDDNAGNPVTTLTTTSEIRTIPIGVLLAIQPSIDLERNEVVMNVRPTLSRITGSVDDPAVALVAASNNVNISSSIPVVEIRELDSVLRLGSGQVMVIGGLMEERTENTDTGVPGVSDVPVVGNAFKRAIKTADVVETVIFIKATIIPGQGVSVEDSQFYNKFSSDRNGL